MSGRKAVAVKAARPARKPVRRVKSAPPAQPVASRNGDASTSAKTLAAEIDRALAQGQTDLLSTEALQALMAAVCRSYSAQIEAGGRFAPLAEKSRVTSTDVMVTASGLLKSANLAVFELGMWQSWTGR
jgi:hypothetical protein